MDEIKQQMAQNDATMSEGYDILTPPHKMAAMQRKVNRTSKALSVVIIAVAALLIVMLFVSLVLSFLTEKKNISWLIFMLVLSVILLFYGVFLNIGIRKNEKFETRRDYEERIRFTKDFAEVVTYRKGEVIGEEKLYYCDLFAVRQKKELLLIYSSATSFNVVDLSTLPPADVAKLHEYLRY